MPVVVTGASGFLGGRLVAMLVERGEQVTVLARAGSDVAHLSPYGSRPGPALRVVRVELAPEPESGGVPAELNAAVRDATHIYHCAGCSTDWAAPATYNKGNVIATKVMLAAAFAAPRLERFVHVSTTDIYGYPVVPCGETAAAHDTGLGYNHTKILGEQAAWQAGEAGLPVTILRPATIYGPRGSAFVTDIAELLRQRMMAIIDGGREPGGFVYVDDVAEAMMAAGASPVTQGEAYNLSSLLGESWKQYCGLLAGALGLRAPWIDLPFGLAMRLAAMLEWPHRSLSVPGRPLLTRHAVFLLGRNQEFPSLKAQEHFGYAPKVSIEQGIELSAAWLRGQKPFLAE